MSKVRADLTTSLDGFVAGPNQTLEQPLGAGGERLHTWLFAAESWRRQHGLSGGEANADSEIVRDSQESTGAVVMGRRMFSGGEGPWESDPNAQGWWGDDPPFHAPVFVVTHHARETLELEGGTFVFVTEGIEAAVAQAKEAAADKDVLVAGGGSVVQEALRSGILDELQVHVVPLLLGGGVRLFDDALGEVIELEATRVIESPAVTHLRYRVVR